MQTFITVISYVAAFGVGYLVRDWIWDIRNRNINPVVPRMKRTRASDRQI